MNDESTFLPPMLFSTFTPRPGVAAFGYMYVVYPFLRTLLRTSNTLSKS